jgi:hypothetical protein
MSTVLESAGKHDKYRQTYIRDLFFIPNSPVRVYDYSTVQLKFWRDDEDY